MRYGGRPAWVRLAVAADIFLICLLALFGITLAGLTANCSPEPEPGRAFLWERQGEPVLLLLESGESCRSGDEVLIRGTLEGETVYGVETVQANRDGVLTLGEDGAVFEERAENVAGRISFESGLFGRLTDYVSDPENAAGTALLAGGGAVLLAVLILAAALLARRYGRLAGDAEDGEDDAGEDGAGEDGLSRAPEAAEEAFVRGVYTQEIREPEEVVSVGDDETPLTAEELERFRAAVMKRENETGENHAK